MKVTPLILFLILLFVLIVSVLFSKYFPFFTNEPKEGFVSFNKSKNILDPVYIPQYSTNSNDMLVKVYDNIFFDGKNGNLIEVDGTVYINEEIGIDENGNTVVIGGNVDTDGTSINSIYVLQRANDSSNIYASIYNTDDHTLISFKTPESNIPNVTNSFLQKIYTTQSLNTDTYQVIYIGWALRTYIHIMNISQNMHVGSFIFGKDTFGQNLSFNPPYIMYGTSQNTLNVGTNTDDSDSKNSNYIKLPDYDAVVDLYQINKSTFFDNRNGNLIVRIGNANIIYTRNGELLPASAPLATRLQSVNFSSWIQPDSNNNMILYMAESDKTVIAIIKQNTNNNYYSVGNVVRFTEDGLETSSISEPAGLYNANGSAAESSEYYKWLAYWNTTVNPRQETSDDYILKTQIVPPVCPGCTSCPSCPSSGICTNCGGQGGSGTLGNDQLSMVQDNQGGFYDSFDNTVDEAGNIIETTVDEAGNIIETTVDEAGNVITTTVDQAGNVISEFIDEAGNVITNTEDNITDLLTGAGTGATNLLTGAGTGAVGLLKSAGSGMTSMISSNGQVQGPSYGQTQPVGQNQFTQGQNTKDYSYNGALPNNSSSSFIPITADFSAFGK